MKNPISIYLKKTIFVLFSFLFITCSKEQPIEENGENNQILKVAFDTDENSTIMFYDGESEEEMTSEERRYEIGKVLRIKPIDDTTIEVANFAPVDIEDATIIATIDIEGVETEIELFTITHIRAHARGELKYPFVEGNTEFLDVNGNTVDLAQFKTSGIPVEEINFNYTGTSELITKLKSLQALNWKFKYHNYDPNSNPDNNWADEVTAKDFRRASGIMINFGYIVLSEEYKTAFLAEHLFDDNLNVLTEEDKEDVYQRLLAKGEFNLGKTVKVGGLASLGPGRVLGFAENIYRDYLVKASTADLTTHEMHHTLGFNHTSNLTYPKTVEGYDGKVGAVRVAIEVKQKMLDEDELPIKLSNYYMRSDFPE